MKRLTLFMLCMMLVCIVIVGCAQQAPEAETPVAPSEQPATKAPEPEKPVEEPSKAPEKPEKFKIGYDIYWLGNTWSVMFAEEFKAAVQLPEYAELIDVVYTESESDTNKMINNVEDLITQECDAIIVTPTSPSALNPVLKKAKAAGIKVILNATVVDDPDAYDALVYYDNYQTSLDRATWLCEKLGGKGKVIEIAGISGYAANEDSIRGHKEILDKYPDIELIATIDGQWDYATTKTEMANVLSAYPQIDGILNQNGHSSLGAIEAMEEANRPLCPILGEDNNGFMKKWLSLKEKQAAGDPLYEKFDAVAHAMPVYISVTALEVALDLLQGNPLTFEENYTYEKAILEKGVGLIDSSMLDKYVYPDMPDGMNTLTTLSEEQLKAIFDK